MNGQVEGPSMPRLLPRVPRWSIREAVVAVGAAALLSAAFRSDYRGDDRAAVPLTCGILVSWLWYREAVEDLKRRDRPRDLTVRLGAALLAVLVGFGIVLIADAVFMVAYGFLEPRLGRAAHRRLGEVSYREVVLIYANDLVTFLHVILAMIPALAIAVHLRRLAWGVFKEPSPPDGSAHGSS